MALIIIILTI